MDLQVAVLCGFAPHAYISIENKSMIVCNYYVFFSLPTVKNTLLLSIQYLHTSYQLKTCSEMAK